MKVCLTCIEFFGDSIYGGFGRSTRFIGAELAKRGVEVSVVVPRRAPDRPDSYELDGIKVHQFSPHRLDRAAVLLRTIDADVYHSQDTSILTPLARIAAPRAAHVLTFRDPMDRHDWNIETTYAGMSPFGWRLYRWFITNPFISWGVRSMDARYCAAEFLIPKTRLLYNLAEAPEFLPSPVHMPASARKNEQPTVCYVGRWEGRKRVELFFDLARRNPGIDFVAVGGNRDKARDEVLRRDGRAIANLSLPGVLDQFRDPEWSRTLGRSWVLVNTSLREGLPTTFVEAAAHGTAILSHTDPDGFATRFGHCAAEGRLSEGLAWLLAEGRWKERGEAGRSFVSARFATDRAMDSHLRAYGSAIELARTRT
ncbi:MAG: glycosyltransferase family 4 protein [Chthoniobacterales bacterium]|nr:glycosyltransferase family 4 protein [Chthoniobacterales bacterium]